MNDQSIITPEVTTTVVDPGLKNNSKGLWIASLLLVALLSIGGTYYWMNGKNNKETADVVNNTIAPTETALPTANPMAGWQTYSNSKYGFSIKYPNNWTPDINQDGNVIPSITSNIKSWATTPDPLNYYVSFELSNETFDSWLKSQGTEFANHFKYTTKVINGYQTYATSSTPDMFSNYAVFFENDNKLIRVVLTPYDNNKPEDTNIKSIFDQMVETFKFTSPTTNVPTGWKTYKNDKYGFEIKYPSELIIKSNPSSGDYLLNVSFNSADLNYEENAMGSYKEAGYSYGITIANRACEDKVKSGLVNFSGLTNYQKITFHDYPAQKYDFKYEGGTGTYLDIDKDRKCWELAGDATREQEFDQILATVKFTN